MGRRGTAVAFLVAIGGGAVACFATDGLTGGSEDATRQLDAGDAAEDAGNDSAVTSPCDAECEPAFVVASGYGRVGLTASSDTVFWTTSQNLYSAALTGDAGDGGRAPLAEDGFEPEIDWDGSRILTATNAGGAGALKLFSADGSNEGQIAPFSVPFGRGEVISRAGLAGLACANAAVGPSNASLGIISTVNDLHDVANATDGPFLDLAVDLSNAFWTTGARPSSMGQSGVMTSPLSNVAPADGGPSARLFAASENPQGVVVQGGFVSWTDISSPPRVLRCKVSGCDVAPTVIFQGQDGVNGPTRIVSTNTDLYWIDAAQGTVATCSVTGCGGAPPRIVATGLVQPKRIALSKRRVLVADWGENGRIISAPQ